MNRYFFIHKPYHTLSQFTSQQGKKTLSDYFSVPANVYAVGRLDYDSEGLLILTNDTQLNQRLLLPQHKHEREYLVQVEGIMSDAAIAQLQRGVSISIDGKPYNTMPCYARLISAEPSVSPRNPPIRFRKNIPASWLSILLTEGKNRQVRKMTAAVGYPTLRLIRYRIAHLTINGLQPGDMREVSKDFLYKQLFDKF